MCFSVVSYYCYDCGAGGQARLQPTISPYLVFTVTDTYTRFEQSFNNVTDI